MRNKIINKISTCTFCFFAALFYVNANAADISIEKYAILLRGEIKAGDAERFSKLVTQAPILLRLDISSPGGDVGEAIRLSELVKGLHIDVQVAKGGYCVSACFFIFLEGHNRFASAALDDGTLRSAEWRANKRGPVGIHRPYLSSPSGDVASINKQEEIMRKTRNYLNAKTVPQHLIDEMMARPSNDIYWLKERDLELIGEYGAGVEEALVAKCGYKRMHQTIAEGWSQDRYDDLYRCMSEHWDTQYLPLQKMFIARLKNGSRSSNQR